MKLQHKQPESYRADKVTVRYDGKQFNLEVDEDGVVQVKTDQQRKALLEDHGGFEELEGDESDLQKHVLADKNVGEVEQYVRDIEDVDRLKELREKEDRKTAIQHIDDRISTLQEKQPVEADYEEVEETHEEQEGEEDEGSGQDEKEGEEAENE